MVVPLDDDEFIDYLIKQIPVGLIIMAYEDYQRTKFKRKVIGKITDADINRLKLELKLGGFKNIDLDLQ